MGMAASMGAFLLSGGEKGKRFILPHSKVMIHQPLGGAYGQASDVEITTKEILKTKDILNKELAKNTGKSLNVIEKDTDRDFYMNAKEAVSYGIVDKILSNWSKLLIQCRSSRVRNDVGTSASFLICMGGGERVGGRIIESLPAKNERMINDRE